MILNIIITLHSENLKFTTHLQMRLKDKSKSTNLDKYHKTVFTKFYTALKKRWLSKFKLKVNKKMTITMWEKCGRTNVTVFRFGKRIERFYLFALLILPLLLFIVDDVTVLGPRSTSSANKTGWTFPWRPEENGAFRSSARSFANVGKLVF